MERFIFHVLNRGVDKRTVFLDDEDYLRFIHDLFEFNDEDPVMNTGYFFKKNSIDVGRRYIKKEGPRKLIVHILTFCIMPNHYHLLLQADNRKNISEFMKKINGGYAKYFNTKYERVGALFQGRYKSIPMTNEAHFIHLPYYIHLNPLDLIMPEWRESEIENFKKAMNFLENYRWSSFPDYIGKKNFPSVTQRDFLLEFFGGENKYKEETERWLKERDQNLEAVKDFALE